MRMGAHSTVDGQWKMIGVLCWPGGWHPASSPPQNLDFICQDFGPQPCHHLAHEVDVVNGQQGRHERLVCLFKMVQVCESAGWGVRIWRVFGDGTDDKAEGVEA